MKPIFLLIAGGVIGIGIVLYFLWSARRLGSRGDGMTRGSDGSPDQPSSDSNAGDDGGGD